MCDEEQTGEMSLALGRSKARVLATAIPQRTSEREKALLASEKDAAEHVMIVDLVRNDWGAWPSPAVYGRRIGRLCCLCRRCIIW